MYSGFEDEDGQDRTKKKIKQGYSAHKELIEEAKMAGSHDDLLDQPSRKIADREDKYLQRKNLRMISPPRHDPFLDKTPDVNSRTYADIMVEQKLENERHEVLLKVAKSKEEQKKKALEKKAEIKAAKDERAAAVSKDRKSVSTAGSTASEWERTEAPARTGASKWDAAPKGGESVTKRNRWDLTPAGGTAEATPGRNRFGETPTPGRWGAEPTPGRFGETPTPGRGKSRWDDKTPVASGSMMTPSAYGGAFTPTPVKFYSHNFSNSFIKSGAMAMGIGTPGMNQVNSIAAMTPERVQQLRWEKEMDERNRPLTDEELDQMLPSAGFEVKFFFLLLWFY